MVDWVVVSALATAGGTLVLAGATFVAVRSAHESARITERALLASIRPLLLAPRLDDPPQKVRFRDDHATLIAPGRALVDSSETAIYLAFGLRNAGSGLAVLDRWRCFEGIGNEEPQLDFSRYRRLTIDLYIPGADVGYWLGTLRDPDEDEFTRIHDAITARSRLTIDVLYGDHEGGQRTLSRFALTPLDGGEWLTQAVRHWNVDRPDPR
jgi:hypothetical protein